MTRTFANEHQLHFGIGLDDPTRSEREFICPDCNCRCTRTKNMGEVGHRRHSRGKGQPPCPRRETHYHPDEDARRRGGRFQRGAP